MFVKGDKIFSYIMHFFPCGYGKVNKSSAFVNYSFCQDYE